MESSEPSVHNLAIVIMAAGKGTRLKSRRPKVLHEVGGKTLLSHVIDAASQIVPPADIFAVVGHQSEKVKAAVASTGIQFVEQTDQRGTGHAIQCTKNAIAGYNNILVLSGDAPLITSETLAALVTFHHSQHAAMTLTTAEPAHPTGYGRIIHPAPNSPEVVAIIEQKMLTPEQLSLPEVNMGLYAFQTAPLLANLAKLTTDNPHGELYLTDMAHVLHAAGERVVAFKTSGPDELLGANTIAEMMTLDATLRLATARRLMASGVTIFRPETVVIDASVEIAPDAVVEPYVQLLGDTKIGSDSRIRMTGIFAASTGFSVQFFPESVILGCGPDAARAYPYTVVADGAASFIKIDAPDHPLRLAFRPDGSLDPGPGSYQVHGRITTGQNENDDFTFAPNEQTCALSALAPSQQIPSSGGMASSMMAAGSSPAGSSPAAPNNNGGILSTPAAPLGNATLSVVPGLPPLAGPPNPFAGRPYILLRHSYGSALAIGGVTVPAGTSPFKYAGTACGTHNADCPKISAAIKADAISAVRADANGRGTFPGVPPGTYYLMISAIYNRQPLVWAQAVQLSDGANSITLNQQDATPLN